MDQYSKAGFAVDSHRTHFSEVNDNAAATILSLFYGLFNSKDQIGTAGADVRSENIGTIAFIMSVEGEKFSNVKKCRKCRKYT